MTLLMDDEDQTNYQNWRFGDGRQGGLISAKTMKIIPLIVGAAAAGHLTATAGAGLFQASVAGTGVGVGSAAGNPAYNEYAFNPGVLAAMDIQAGDLFMATSTAGLNLGGVILAVHWGAAGAGSILVSDATDHSALSLASCYIIKTFASTNPRSEMCNGRLHVLEMRPRMSFFNHEFPLFILRNGVMIEFELDNPARVLKFLTVVDIESTTRSLAGDYWYFMQNARFICKFSTPHPSIISTLVDLWNSDRGLVYPMDTYVMRTFTGVGGTGSDNIRVNMGMRSVRFVVTVCYDQELAENNTKITAYNDSLSGFFRGSIYTFQYQIGANFFPANKVYVYGVDSLVVNNSNLGPPAYKGLVQTALANGTGSGTQFSVTTGSQGYFNSNYSQLPYELYEHAMQCFPTPYASRMSVDAFNSNHTFCGAITGGHSAIIQNESDKFFMCADFSRDNGPGGVLSGTDTSIVPLQLNVERNTNLYTSTNLSVPRYYVVALCDQIITMSSQGINQLN